jgi:hypothetical protein
MANLTITVSEEVLRDARLRALERGTSVNALLRDYLEAFAGTRSEQQQAIRRVIERAARSSSGSRGRRWARDELHER